MKYVSCLSPSHTHGHTPGHIHGQLSQYAIDGTYKEHAAVHASGILHTLIPYGHAALDANIYNTNSKLNLSVNWQ